MRELPPDLRPWTLRYPGWCRISGEELLVGDDAFWSPSRHYVYSKETVRYLRAHEEFIADQAAGRGDGIPPVPPTGSQGEDLSHQRQWTRPESSSSTNSKSVRPPLNRLRPWATITPRPNEGTSIDRAAKGLIERRSSWRRGR